MSPIIEGVMTQVAKIFNNGRSQAVRLPAAFRFEGTEVFIRRDETSGDVILSRRPESWDGLLAAIREGGVPDDFLNASERAEAQDDRDPFADVSS
ncbi:antitoxin [Komagataeibacter sp. SM21]|uniref:antitoxin n=1 Tax=Komagataeibacter sp. SM21 TaxID=3242899 RepID=UPI0035283108